MSVKISTVNAEQFRDCVFFRLRIRKPGVHTKVKDMAKLEEYLKALHVELSQDNQGTGNNAAVQLPANFRNGNGAVKVTKRILTPLKATADNPNPDPFENTGSFLSEVKEKLCGRFGKALPSMIDEGLFVVRKDLVQEFEDELRATVDKLEADYIPAVLADYPVAKERARTAPLRQGGLGPLYREADYPHASDFASRFSLEWQWLALGVPEDLPAALRAEAADKLEKQFTEAAEEVKNALRESFQELITHASEKLKPAEAGEKPPVFRDSLIGNIQAFIDSFNARNLMNDTELETLVSSAKQVLVGLNPDRLRKFASVRETTREQFAAIQTQLDGMITTQKGRKFDLSDD